MEYAQDGIRVNAVAPGVVATPLHDNTPSDVMKTLSPMGRVSTVKEIATPLCSSPTRRQSPETFSTSTAGRILAGGDQL